MIQELWCLLDILLAGVMGFLIGLERKFRSKEAAIRTHTIVCLASALFMVISKYAFDATEKYDAARVAAQIIPGIGFLGAGMIIYKKNVVHGLTTAAGVWATAGVGMACGGRLYIVAAVSAVMLILLQLLFHSKLRLFHTKKVFRLNIVFQEKDKEADIIKDLFKVEHFHRFQTSRKNDEIFCEAALFTEIEYSSEQLNNFMKQYPFISSIQRVDEE